MIGFQSIARLSVDQILVNRKRVVLEGRQFLFRLLLPQVAKRKLTTCAIGRRRNSMRGTFHGRAGSRRMGPVSPARTASPSRAEAYLQGPEQLAKGPARAG